MHNLVELWPLSALFLSKIFDQVRRSRQWMICRWWGYSTLKVGKWGSKNGVLVLPPLPHPAPPPPHPSSPPVCDVLIKGAWLRWCDVSGLTAALSPLPTPPPPTPPSLGRPHSEHRFPAPATCCSMSVCRKYVVNHCLEFPYGFCGR